MKMAGSYQGAEEVAEKRGMEGESKKCIPSAEAKDAGVLLSLTYGLKRLRKKAEQAEKEVAEA